MHLRHFAASLALLALSAYGQGLLDDATIGKLVKAGVGEETIVAMINQQPGKYALSSDDMIALKNAGVSDRIMAAMIVRNGTGNGSSPAPAEATNAGIPNERNLQLPVARDAAGGSQPPHSGPIRVYITDSQSWEIRGGWSSVGHWGAQGGGWAGSGYQAGGARPQTAEIIKTFNQRCPEITVTNRVDNADFAVTLDHEGGKGLLRRRNKMVIFNRNGDDIFSDSTRELGNSVKDGCDAILRNGAPGGSSGAAANSGEGLAAPVAANPPPARPMTGDGLVDIAFSSSPQGAMVSMYGTHIGRTPFTTRLAPGAYKVTFSADGKHDLNQDISVGPGYSPTVHAAFESKP
jgi:hypothetical protein